MPIEFPCENCKKLLRVPDGSAGKKAQCPSCQTVLEIPTASPPPKADPILPPVGPSGLFSPGASAAGSSPFSGPGSFAPPGHAPLGPTPPTTPPPISDNPFASPTAASEILPDAIAARGPIVPTRIHFIFLEEIGKVFRENFGNFLLMGLAFLGLVLGLYVLMIGATMLSFLVVGAQGPNAGASGWIVIVAVMLFFYLAFLVGCCWLYLGSIRYCLRVARGEPSSLSDLFSGAPFLLRGMGLGFFQFVIIYAILFGCMAPGFALQNQALVLGGEVLGLVLNIPILLLFSPAMCLIVDHNLGVFRSIGTSFNIMRGNFLIATVIWLITSLLGVIVVVFTCGLGYIAFIPFLILTLVMIYLGASGQLTDRYANV